MPRVLYYVYFFIIFLNTLIGAYQYKKMDKALHIFYVLTIAIFINEVISFSVNYLYNAEAIISHIYSVFELSLTTIYFLHTIYPKPKRSLIIVTIAISFVLALIDLHFQKLETYNNYMIVVECLLICPQALYVLYKTLNSDDIAQLSNNPHFYIWRALLIWWSVTFFYWEFFIYIKKSQQYPTVFIYYLLFNILVYGMIGITFLRLKGNPILVLNKTQ
jgi:hypothetical protein